LMRLPFKADRLVLICIFVTFDVLIEGSVYDI
jgi:hypothetical protein